MKFIKTEAGQQAFKARSPLFSARQRSAFILVDGTKTVDQVLAATSGLGVTQVDLDHLVEQGFLSVLAEPVAATQPGALAPVIADEPPSNRTPQERYFDAKPLATQLTASMGLRGFMLNLSVESAAGYDDLLILFPKIQDALGSKACRELERALKG
ncbi:hypothetical protein [Rhodoferax saidenbachensis]|uniref:Uncharacterized protein n=1 Tax=Rhodoferax saidenbachensis TaxID=1484693 RepID=A0A1P8K6N8_9BURK|nr:hypothetical protein [Rhodoferax saidenbachensis]APW41680.1 hypothetical protein RS694_03360 [Rhodoferax saidenbachensis]